MQISAELQLILADFENDDEIHCSVFPAEVFGLPATGVFDTNAIAVLGEFNLIMAERNVVALPSYVQGMSGVFLAKLSEDVTDNDREVFAMFLEPVQEQIFVDDLHYGALVSLLDPKL